MALKFAREFKIIFSPFLPRALPFELLSPEPSILTYFYSIDLPLL
ncbi:MAG: hypothetical protein PHE87_01950 [Victivallaceae bacterium]|nr:hypothetical protein [Victivallaceae bacterium]